MTTKGQARGTARRLRALPCRVKKWRPGRPRHIKRPHARSTPSMSSILEPFMNSSHPSACVTDAASLRRQLMAPDPLQRAIGLYALEVEVSRCSGGAHAALSQEAARFAARGIPYYALHDRHFQHWVGRAVSYWERLHDSGAR